MNADKLMVIISLRWKSPSSTFIRLCKHFILIMPRVDVVSSVGLTWLDLESVIRWLTVLASWRLSGWSALAWKAEGTWMNSSPPSSLPLGLYAQNGNWLWRSRTGTRSLNATKHRFDIASGSSSSLSGTSGSSTYFKLSSILILTNVKLSLLIRNWFLGTGRWRIGITVWRWWRWRWVRKNVFLIWKVWSLNIVRFGEVNIS